MRSNLYISLIFFIVNAVPDNPKPGPLMKYHIDETTKGSDGEHVLKEINNKSAGSLAYVTKHAMIPNHDCKEACNGRHADGKPKEQWWCHSQGNQYVYFDDDYCEYVNFDSSNGDCANYVSQVLQAGGVLRPRLNPGNHENSYAAIKLWDLRAGLNRLKWERTQHDPCKIPKGTQVGDVLIYLEEFDNNFTSGTRIKGHAVFIVEIDIDNGMAYISGHTPRVKRAKFITFLKPGRMKCEIWHGRSATAWPEVYVD